MLPCHCLIGANGLHYSSAFQVLSVSLNFSHLMGNNIDSTYKLLKKIVNDKL